MRLNLKYVLGLIFFVILSNLLQAGFIFADDGAPRVIYETQESVEEFDMVFDELLKERDALRKEIANFRTEQQTLIGEAKRDIEGTDDEVKNYRNVFDVTDAKINGLNSEKEVLSGELDGLKERVVEITAESNNKDRVIADAEAERRQLIDQLNEAEQSLLKAAERIGDLQEEKSSLSRELDTVLKERQKAPVSLAKGENGDEPSEGELDSELFRQDTTNRMDMIQDMLIGTQRKAESLIEKQKEEISRLETEEERLRKELEEVRAKNDVLKNEGFSSMPESAGQQFMPTGEKTGPYEEKLGEVLGELKKTQDQLSFEKEKFKGLSQEAENAQKSLRELRQDLDKRDEKFKIAKDSIGILEKKVDLLKQKISYRADDTVGPAAEIMKQPADSSRQQDIKGKALKLLEARQYKEAQAVFQDILKKDPDDKFAHYYLGVIYSKYLKDKDKAAEHFQDSLVEF